METLLARKSMQKEAGRTNVFCPQDYFRCPNKAKVCRDGKWYCGVHDPVAVRARHEKREDDKRKKQRASAAFSTKLGDGEKNWEDMSEFDRKEIDRLQNLVIEVEAGKAEFEAESVRLFSIAEALAKKLAQATRGWAKAGYVDNSAAYWMSWAEHEAKTELKTARLVVAGEGEMS